MISTFRRRSSSIAPALPRMFRVHIIQGEILALHISEFAQALVECGIHRCRPRLDCHNTDARHRLRLRACGERPRRRRTAKCGYELPSTDIDCHGPSRLGLCPLKCMEEYHTSIPSSVPYFTVVRPRKRLLLFCGAK